MFRKGLFCWLFLIFSGIAQAQEETKTLAEKIDEGLGPISDGIGAVIFFAIPLFGQQVPLVLLLLAFTAAFLTVYFKGINVRSFGLAVRTVKGKYSSESDQGQITHFQALTTAVSATVGLGNIAGVALAIGLGGPGAVFWMIVMGLLGMTSKFTECTLGVKYRKIDSEGKVSGGGMYYLRDGLAERGFGAFGMVLAIIFAVACIGGAIGAGNMFQVNQAYAQISDTFGILSGDNGSVIFGVIVAILVGAVILGGIVSIARVTSFLVPFMCIAYILACLVVLLVNIGDVPGAIGTIVGDAFSGKAAGGGAAGGLLIAVIQGIRRGVFSNEAGVGSAAIAHGAVKTSKPASEGIVALLEPFIDTVIVCTMTALVIVTTGVWKIDATVNDDLLLSPSKELTTGTQELKADTAVKVVSSDEGWVEVKVPDTEISGFVAEDAITKRSGTQGGIWLTSRAFSSVISWFPGLLAIAVFLFAFSTMISWSYYGEQAVNFLTNGNSVAIIIYKIFFCLCVVVGASASLGNVMNLSDSMFFAMVGPNLIGLYLLLPVVKKELADFRQHAADVDARSKS